PGWAGEAIALNGRLRSWSQTAGVPLRVTGHFGEVDRFEGADGRAQLVGPGINFAAKLNVFSGAPRVVVSHAFRAACESDPLPGVRFHDPRHVRPAHFPEQPVALLSVDGAFESEWDEPVTDRERLRHPSAGAWELVYRAKRLLQLNARDEEALRALDGLRNEDLTYRPRDGKEATNELIRRMDTAPPRTAFFQTAQLIERGADELLCRFRDEGDTICLIVRGAVGVYLASGTQPPDHTGQPNVVLGPGEIVGELAFALHRPRTATVRCLTPVALLAFSYAQLRAALRGSPFRDEVMAEMDRFATVRALEHLCTRADYLVGAAHAGPLGKVEKLWEKWLPQSELVSYKPGRPLRWGRRPGAPAAPALAVLMGGQVTTADGRHLDGTDLPVLHADLPGLGFEAAEFTAVSEARVLCVRPDALRALTFAQRQGLTDAVRAALARRVLGPAGTGGDEAFSSHTVLLRYPAPIALAYRRFYLAHPPLDRVTRLFQALEVTLKYLTFLGLSDLFRHRAEAPGRGVRVYEEEPAFEFLRRPVNMTLGMWVQALRETARASARHARMFVPELGRVWAPGGAADRLAGDLVRVRNGLVHGKTDPDECARLVREVRPKIEELFQHVGFVRAYPLGYVSRLDSGRGDTGRYRIHSLMGVQPAGGEPGYALETPDRFDDDAPFVLSPDGARVLYLWPFLLLRPELSGRGAVFACESTTRGYLGAVSAVPLDHGAPAEFELAPGPQINHDWLLDRVRQRVRAEALADGRRVLERLSGGREADLENQTLGPYRLLRQLAAGGFGRVFAATAGGEMVAVKVLGAHVTGEHLTRFRQEFDRLRAAGGRHGVIRCHTYEETVIGGHLYCWYAMEFAAGGDLSARIRERVKGPDQLPWAEPHWRDEIAHEFQAVASAVAYLHGLGIVHRDIKPANVLIMEDGSLRLSDFGLIKPLDPDPDQGAPNTSVGAVLGTRPYMAPEQREGRDVGKPADVYALGVLLAELATGQRVGSDGPHPGRPVDQLAQPLPDPLRRFVLRCTDPRPDKRPADAAAVCTEFVALLDRLRRDPAS
ncbi:MAG TPA: protein kinase, partial [Gemmata sp.]